MTAVWASPQLDPAGVLIHFILGLVAALIYQHGARSCCKLAENCLHTGRTVCNPFQCKRPSRNARPGSPMPRNCVGPEAKGLPLQQELPLCESQDTFRSLNPLAWKFYLLTQLLHGFSQSTMEPGHQGWAQDSSAWPVASQCLMGRRAFLPRKQVQIAGSLPKAVLLRPKGGQAQGSAT